MYYFERAWMFLIFVYSSFLIAPFIVAKMVLISFITPFRLGNQVVESDAEQLCKDS